MGDGDAATFDDFEDVDNDLLWDIREDWGRRIAAVLRLTDIEAVIVMVAAQMRQSGDQITNGGLVERIVHGLADRIELLPHALAEEPSEGGE